MNWKQKEVWSKRGNETFFVEVCHWTDIPFDGKGPHRWNVYAYIFPGHPLWANLLNDERRAADDLHFHWYVSFFQASHDHKGKVTRFCFGSDYGHLYDERFSHMATKDEAWEVFADAEKLFKQLEGTAEKEEGE